ncbi:MAG TPA: glycosyltransferase, partial [Puia sp.]
PQKGSLELLRYFKALWDKGFSQPLHIVGGTDIVYHPEKLTMGQLANRDYKAYIAKGLLVFHGKIKPAELEQELRSARVIVFPSIVDNLPYVVIEAMSLGKIVLASVQGGQREMIDSGISGYLFDHELPGDFERQLEQVLSLTEEQVMAIGTAAREKVRSMYDPGAVGPQKLALLNAVIREAGTGRTFPFLYQEPFEPLVEEGNDLLSVVIPYYNMGDFIEECVRSVQASAYPSIEILVIDDGSRDDKSVAVLTRLEQTGNVKIYRKPNEGLAETRNFGARKAEGRYLAFLDADDRVAPEYYEKAIRVLAHYPNVFFAGSWVEYFGNTKQQWTTYTPQPPYLLVHNPVNSSGLIYKKAAFLRAGLNDKTVDYGLEDYESVVHLMAAGYNGIVLPELFFFYQVRSGSMFRKITREKLLYSYKYITEKHAAYYTKFAPSIIHLLNANGPGYLFDNPTFGITVSATPESRSRWRILAINLVKKNKFLKKFALKIIKK